MIINGNGSHKALFAVFLLLIAATGCNDPDKNGGGSNLTPPTVTFVTPANGDVGVCPTVAIISATFSKAMNPATINTTTFTLAGPGGTNVPGSVSYSAATNVATFTPTSSLALNTMYAATITTGVADTFGNQLAVKFTWSFTTAVVPCTPPPGPVNLGTACSFGILGATPVVSSIGPTIITGGDVGIWPAASVTGFPPGTLTGSIHLGDAVAMTAQGDLTTAYNNAAGAPGGAVLPADIGGLTLAGGVYKTTSAQPSLGITGNLTLSGNATDVWIFQIVSSLTTAAGNSQVIMAGGALAKNVFWQVGSSATLGTNTTFAGNTMTHASITMNTGATLNGRALAQTGAITMDSNPVNVPTPCP